MRAVEDLEDEAVALIGGMASVGFDWIAWAVGRNRRGTTAEVGEWETAVGEAIVTFAWVRSWGVGRRGLKKVGMLRKLGVLLVC